MNAGSPEAATLYRELILGEAERVLGLMDREEGSPTSGSCDREFWAWKFVDFPRSRFQEALCVLAFLHAEPSEGNLYHGDPRLARWIEAGLSNWCGLQHRDGSFDEAYPFERSLAATAFTSFYVAEALGFLGEGLAPDLRSRVVASLVRAADWLCANDETHGVLSNHLAAAAAALAHASALTCESRYRERRDHFLRRILEHQSSEGWYEEYGGADPGYQTHGSFYLARILELEANEELAESLEHSMRFLSVFVHPDGSIGGEYASRNTKTYYPAAFEMRAHASPVAAWIAERMRPSVASGRAAGLRGVDAFNHFPLLNNLVFAYRAVIRAASRDGGETPRAEEPVPGEGLTWFPEAGLARVRRERYDAVVGTSKGGVVLLFDRRERGLAGSDCGYLGRLRGGEAASTQVLEHGRRVDATAERIEVAGELHAFGRPTMSPLRFLLFRLFTLTVGRHPALAGWLKRRLAEVLIHRRRRLGVRFTRRLRFEEDRVVIEDEIGGPDASRLESLSRGERFTTIHMGSARYFVPGELVPAGPDDGGRDDGASEEVPVSALVRGTKLTRRLSLR